MPTPYIHRETSWLAFNRRVLEEAQDARNPLLERLRFLAIYGSNLDEFFMVRIGSLKDQILSGMVRKDALTNQTPAQQLNMILSQLCVLTKEYEKTKHDLFTALKGAGIVHIDTTAADDRVLASVKKHFMQMVLPLLTAVIIDLKHPFPFLPSGAVFVAARLKSKNGEKLGLVLFPEVTPRLARVEADPLRFFLIEEAAVRFAADIFPKYDVVEAGLFRVTRNADLVLDDDTLSDDADYRKAMAHILEKRKHLAPVRLQSNLDTDAKLTRLLAKQLGLDDHDIFCESCPLGLGFTADLIDAARAKGFAHLLFDELPSVYVPGLKRGESVMAQTRHRDHLMIHPYVSFDAVLALLREAAFDPAVVAIRQTLYRVARESEVVRYLAAAAQNGKQVTVVVELKARFDEASNLNWAAALEQAGCRVIYGGHGLKVHAKLLLVTRSTPKGLRHTAHIATGNYNEKTTRQYSDIGLITSDTRIADDIILMFRELGTGMTGGAYRALCTSPGGIRQTLCRFIDTEIDAARAGKAAHLIFKVNSLSDKRMIDKLIEASSAGVKIDLIVRGICCVKAGMAQTTQNIRVVSVVGRFLEHARAYWFSSGDALFISSADLMTRNLDMRVEAMCPVWDKRIAAKIKRMLLIQLCDTDKGRVMRPDGSYARLKMAQGVCNSQLAQYELCAEEDIRNQTRRPALQAVRSALGRALVHMGRRMTPES